MPRIWGSKYKTKQTMNKRARKDYYSESQQTNRVMSPYLEVMSALSEWKMSRDVVAVLDMPDLSWIGGKNEAEFKVLVWPPLEQLDDRIFAGFSWQTRG